MSNEYFIEENSIKYITKDFLFLTDVERMIFILEEADVDPNIEIYDEYIKMSLFAWVQYNNVTRLEDYLYYKTSLQPDYNTKENGKNSSTKLPSGFEFKHNWVNIISLILLAIFYIPYAILIIGLALLIMSRPAYAYAYNQPTGNDFMATLCFPWKICIGVVMSIRAIPSWNGPKAVPRSFVCECEKDKSLRYKCNKH